MVTALLEYFKQSYIDFSSLCLAKLPAYSTPQGSLKLQQAWGQVHLKILKYKYFETFASTSTSTASYPCQVLKYNTSTLYST